MINPEPGASDKSIESGSHWRNLLNSDYWRLLPGLALGSGVPV
jgi:hypothetical protein